MNIIDTLQPGLNGAFLREGFQALPVARGATNGPLLSSRLAVKDVFDIEGLRTGAGNPAWLAAQTKADKHALTVRLLLDAGAQWIGKTVTDELTYSLAGVNFHYGTPVNPAAPSRLPGGSSSGSAVAVAAGYADIALGTDCGGSVRLPASYCGVWGMRPTHGRIAVNGCFTLAHSFDTVGWFARNGELLAKVFEQLAHSRIPAQQQATTLIIPADARTLLDSSIASAFVRTVASLEATHSVSLLGAGALSLEPWSEAFRTLQAAEVWQQHGIWVRSSAPALGQDVAQRFDAAEKVSASQVQIAQRTRSDAIARLSHLLGEQQVFLMPTVPTVAPDKYLETTALNNIRTRSQHLLCIAGLAGLPQVTMPWTIVEDAPVGLSLIGARGQDELVLRAALDLHVSVAVGRVA